MLVFAPSSVQEIVNLIGQAFDLAETYRMPAMILADGMLGQMMEPVVFPETAPAEHDKSWALTGTKNERKPNIINSLYLQPQQLEDTVVARQKRYDVIKEKEVQLETQFMDDAEFAVVAYGATSRVVKSAVAKAREKGIKVGLIRPITLWPFPMKEIGEAAKKVKAMLTVEMSMGQMVEDVRLAANGACPVGFYGRTGGIVPTPAEVLAEIEKMAGGAR